MDLSWLKAIAPTVATALGGPLAGLAVQVVGSALGVEPDKVQDMITKGQLSGDQLLALKQAELDLKKQEEELGFKYEQLDYNDRADARKRQADTHDETNTWLAFIIIGSFIAVVGTTLMGMTKVDSVLAGTLIGYLSAKAEQVLTYYFGSTRQSSAKTQLLADQLGKKS